MQTLMVTRDGEGKIESVKVYPEEIEVVLTEAQLKTFDLLNDRGIVHLIDTARKEKQGDLFQK